MLALPARERGLLLVLEDAHWADGSTRELLDHLARRFSGLRALVLVTYRADELERRHPLLPLLQAWRCLGVADTVTLRPLAVREVAEMIAAILDEDEVANELGALMHARAEGNPFVLEEMLREAIDRGDVFRTGAGWESRSLDELRVPDTVKDAILLRVGRLDPAHVEVLRAAAVLGRSFAYDTLAAVASVPEEAVQDALAAAVAQQLVEELPGPPVGYRWRHALTQEAVADEIVLPRRQQTHSRAADALLETGAGSTSEVAGHLLAAGRFEEAVPACIRAAEEAERTLAFTEAIELLERALPHAHEPVTRARLLCRMGRALWVNGQPAAAEQVLAQGVEALGAAGELVEAARFRLVLGRCLWELSRPPAAMEQFERARDQLEAEGPSAELALAYMRLAGLPMFDLDYEGALETARRAVEVAEEAGAEAERIWASSFVALALFGLGRPDEALAMLDRCFREAAAAGLWDIAQNVAYNETFCRIHTLVGGSAQRLAALDAMPGTTIYAFGKHLVESYVLRTSGQLSAALTSAAEAVSLYERAGAEKFAWRCRGEKAEVLLELGRVDEAWAVLPSKEERTELQDVVYEAAAQIRCRLARGAVDEAVELAREIAASAERFAQYPDTAAVAVEALVAAGELDEAAELVARTRKHARTGLAFVDEADARVLLARGDAAAARSLAEQVARVAAENGFRLVELRARLLAAEAGQDARELAEIVEETEELGAVLIRDAALAGAKRMGVRFDQRAPVAAVDEGVPEQLVTGERLVTSLFADVRGYTTLSGSSAPADLADRLGALYRWAAAEVTRHHGFVDKFAGDAVMATFNATGARVDHTVHALEAALALRDKAALLDLGVGIGIAVGPAVVGRSVAGANVSVLGEATNLAARLQAAASAGEILLSDEAHRRTRTWLGDRGLEARRDELMLKGFDGPQPAWRIPSER